MNRVTLIEKELTGSIIEAFFEVYNELGHGCVERIYMTRQIVSYLRATSIELGLLLHFGASPRFYRFVSTNRQTQGARIARCTSPREQ